MKFRARVLVGVLTGLLVVPSSFAAELDGVTLPDSAEVGGKTIPLNGLGLRKAFVFAKVYVAGLYLQTKTTDAKKATDTDETKRISMRFVREISHDEMNKGMADGFAITAPNSLQGEQAALKGFFNKPLKEGDVCNIDYVPGTGTTVTINGKKEGTIAGAPFMRALWGIWLAPNPPGGDALRDGMLGKG
ncbi:MAG: chalcone isomerase family protein [Candidatus Binatia bacterium]|nr:chalcone isomerase family protein [Candidatus Binatia bacterium]